MRARRVPTVPTRPRPLDADLPGLGFGVALGVFLLALILLGYLIATGDTGRPEDPLNTPATPPAALAPGETAAAAETAQEADMATITETDLELILAGLDADDPVRPTLSVALLNAVADELCPTIPDHRGDLDDVAAWLADALAADALTDVAPRDREYIAQVAVTAACWPAWSAFTGLA